VLTRQDGDGSAIAATDESSDHQTGPRFRERDFPALQIQRRQRPHRRTVHPRTLICAFARVPTPTCGLDGAGAIFVAPWSGGRAHLAHTADVAPIVRAAKRLLDRPGQSPLSAWPRRGAARMSARTGRRSPRWCVFSRPGPRRAPLGARRWSKRDGNTPKTAGRVPARRRDRRGTTPPRARASLSHPLK
jgi:hypothetical protein